MPEIWLVAYNQNMKRLAKVSFKRNVNVGKWASTTILVQNVSKNLLEEVTFGTDDDDVFIEPYYIESMKPKQIVKLKFIWIPKNIRVKDLSTPIKAVFRVIKIRKIKGKRK